VKWTAAGGAAAVVVLLAASAVERTFCLPCFVSHALAAAYAGLALLRWPVAGWSRSFRGLGMAATLGLAAFLVLLVPGQRTPPARTDLSEFLPATTPPPATALAPPATTSAAAPIPAASAPPAAPEPDADSSPPPSLDAFVASLPPNAQQALSDALAGYRAAPEARPQRARLVIGAKSAPVRITEFTDVLCPHCAELHETLETMRARAPRGSFQIEPRQYPLDGECNPQVRRGGAPVRCLAAKALICTEGKAGYLDFSGALFREQQSLTPEKVRALATPYLPGAELDRCLESPDTQTKLADDIKEASRHDIHGTPLVLVNGRKGSAVGPFLYAVVLSRGLPWHPAFNLLPAPRAAEAHAH
jgi:serine/threonine-protein kinase